MRWFLLAAILITIAGVGCLVHAHSFPVYLHPRDPGRLSRELAPSHSRVAKRISRETQFNEWYSRLALMETPHKRWADLGRGLCAAGVGLLGAIFVWKAYHGAPWMRSEGAIYALWMGLWLVQIPLIAWYYQLRQARFDFPVWGDDVAIPILSRSIACILGGFLSSFILGLFLHRRKLPSFVRIVRPMSAVDWVRAVFLALWIVVLAARVFSGIPDGQMGPVFVCTIASVVLLIVLSAPEIPAAPESLECEPAIAPN